MPASDGKRSCEKAATPKHEMVPIDAPEVDVKRSSQLDETLPPRFQARYRDSFLMKAVTASPVLTAAIMFVTGGICIRYFCNPATFRRRFTVLGLYTGVVWWTQKRTNSTALFWNTIETIQASESDALVEFRKGGQFAKDFVLCLPILANGDSYYHAKSYEVMMSQATDEAAQKYLVEEEKLCRDLSFTDRLSYKYRISRSSAKTRALIAGVLRAQLAKLSLLGHIPDEDVRRCASHIADATENKSVISTQTDWYDTACTTTFAAAMIFSKPWILRTAAVTGIVALSAYIAEYGRRTQVLSEPTRYSTPDIGSLLHASWLAWVDSHIPPPQNGKTS